MYIILHIVQSATATLAIHRSTAETKMFNAHNSMKTIGFYVQASLEVVKMSFLLRNRQQHLSGFK